MTFVLLTIFSIDNSISIPFNRVYKPINDLKYTSGVVKMKKCIIIIGAVFSILLIMSSVTAAPHAQSKPVMKIVETIKQKAILTENIQPLGLIDTLIEIIRSLIGLVNKIIQFIFREEPFEISYDVPLDTAIERLKSVVKKVPVFGFDTKGMAGSVSEKNVNIRSLDTGLAKVIIGSFKSDGNKTIFSGVFRHRRSYQVFTSCCFGFLLLLTFASLFAAIIKGVL